jgi:uncharacterized SAM-binding protein YcdF (DUF218 family)
MSKVLPIIFSPIFVILLLILLGLLTRRRIWSMLAFAILFSVSLPGLVDPFYSWAQGGATKKTASSMPEVDAIVVLGGAVSFVPGVAGYTSEWGDSVDRVLGGVDLYHAGRSRLLILSSGLPGSPVNAPTEGTVNREFALSLGVAPSAIFLLPSTQNTYAEARALSQYLGEHQQKVILVTSAFHMPRASLIFRNFGFDVSEFPVDIRLPMRRSWGERWLPSAQSVMKVDIALRELIGRAYYRLKFCLESLRQSR